MPLVGLLVFVAGLCLGPMQESDLFFRLAAGEHFLRTGHILHHNLFSFTYPDQPYLDPAWLFDVAVALLHRLGGFPAVVLGKTFLVLLIVRLAYRLCRARGASATATALGLGLALFCMRERLVERPHIFSLLGEIVVLGLVGRPDKKTRLVWILVPLVALWANLHAGAFLGPWLLGLAFLGALLDRAKKTDWLLLLGWTLASLLALLATPVGLGMLRYLSFHVGIFDLHPVDEFRNVTWRSDAPFILFAASGVAILALSRRESWQERLPAFGLLVVAFGHVRFTADSMLVLAVTVAPALSRLMARIVDTRAARIATPLVLFLATLAPRMAEASREGRWLAIDLDESALPLDALAFAERHGLRDRMYNDFELGAYLIWRDFPRHRVFVDPRLPAYPTSFHRLLGDMNISWEGWTRAMDALGVESALLDYAGINRRVAFWDPDQWALIYRAKDSRVFVRRLPKWRALIARLEIPARFSFTVESGAVTIPMTTPPATSPVPACEWQVRLGDLVFDLDQGKRERATAAYRLALEAPLGCLDREHERSTAAWVGAMDFEARRFEQALPLFDRALTIAPADTAILADKALALEALGRATEARAAWARVAELAPGTEIGRRAAARAKAAP